MDAPAASEPWCLPAFDAMPVGILVVDDGLTLRYVNARAREISGHNPRLRIGIPYVGHFREMYGEAAADRVRRELEGVLATGQALSHSGWSLADRVESPLDRQIDLSLHRWQTPEGGFALVLTLSDVTEHVRAKSEALRAEERYRALVAATTQIVWKADALGAVVHDLPQWRLLTGQSPAEILGDGWRAAVDPADRERVAAVWRHSVATGQPHENRFQVRDARGGWRALWAHMVPVRDARGAVAEWIGTCTDISLSSSIPGGPDAPAHPASGRTQAGHLHAFLDGIPQMVWSAAPNGDLDFANRVWTEYTGLPVSAALGSGWAAVVHPDDVGAAHARWTRSLETGEAYEHRFRLRAADGGFRWFLVRALPSRQANGPIVHWLGTCTDFHDQQVAEDRYRSLAEGARHVIWTNGPDGRLRYINEFWHELTGQDTATAADSWHETIHPEDLAGLADIVQRSEAEGRAWSHEYRLRCRERVFRWQQTRAWPRRDAAGNLLEWHGVTIDIDERKRAERRLAFLGDVTVRLTSSLEHLESLRQVARLAVPDIADWCTVDLVDDEGALHRIAVAHADPARVALAEDLRASYPPRPDSLARRVIASGKLELIETISDAMLEAHAQDPRHLELLRGIGFSSCALLALRARGRVVGLVTLVQAESNRRFTAIDREFLEDVSNRIAMAVDNARLFEAEKSRAAELAQRNAELDRFAAVTAHDLQSPLRTVMSYLGLIELRARDSLSPAAVGWIRTTIESASRMRVLIDGLLDYARGAHVPAETLAPTPLADPLGEALANLESAIHESDAQLLVEELPTIHGSRMHLLLLFQNLVSNAIKFRDRGRRLEIRISAVRDGGAWVVTVSDNGSGIPPEARERVFTLFERFHADISGTGIGLATCRRIVDMHQGRIWIDEAPGSVGTAFRISFPSAVDDRAPGAAPR